MKSNTIWDPALEILANSKPDLKILRVVSVSKRSIVLFCQTDLQTRTIFKISHETSTLRFERQCLSEISHPNIVSLKSSWSQAGFLFLELMEAPGLCLVEILEEKGRLPENECLLLTKQLVTALSFLHSKGWVHRDIKPDNLMFDQTTGHLTLIDFELATQFGKGKTLTQKVGTFRYCSPEVWRRCYQGPECDAWSLGVTLFVVLTGRFPFPDSEGVSQGSIIRALRRTKCSPGAKDLIRNLLEVEPKNRMTIEGISDHFWFTGSEPSTHQSKFLKVIQHVVHFRR